MEHSWCPRDSARLRAEVREAPLLRRGSPFLFVDLKGWCPVNGQTKWEPADPLRSAAGSSSRAARAFLRHGLPLPSTSLPARRGYGVGLGSAGSACTLVGEAAPVISAPTRPRRARRWRSCVSARCNSASCLPPHTLRLQALPKSIAGTVQQNSHVSARHLQ